MAKTNKITWSPEKRKVEDLIPADYNPRGMTAIEKEQLARSVEEYGTAIPLVVNIGKRKNVLIGGHQRREIYLEKGIKEIDVMVPSRELTLEEEKTLNLRMNKNTGHWQLDKIPEFGLDLLLDVGFGEEELSGIWNDVDVIDDGGDEVIRKAREEKPITKKGDIWKLGSQTLYVSANGYTPKEKVAMVWYDRPVGKEAEKEMEYMRAQVQGFADNAHWFIWTVPEKISWTQMVMAGIEDQTVLLHIRKMVAAAKKYETWANIYDPCCYGTTGKPYINAAMKNMTEILTKDIAHGNGTIDDILSVIDIWLSGKNNTESGKPVTVCERPIKRCTKPGDTIVSFGGIGEMLIACHQTGRYCDMVADDEQDATVIIRRWEAFSGAKAKKI